eukprot:TRINITY_DN396_c0_g2_i22.p1 TRINITY_DN396_c0_g2~~TRINITY_DN396_c0_g2_i22.p1  ORF type:complete len:156 (+),score=34.15 TRINITY_DN396_c0_g2_i22:175-642(+)
MEVLRYTDNTFLGDEVGTIGADFKVKFIQVAKKNIKMQIWDTAGQEKFRTMTSSYFAGANAVIIVFDLSNKASYESVDKWMKEAKRFNTGHNQVSFLIVGNKSDLPPVGGLQETAKKFAAVNDAIYCETSALSGDRVSDAFMQIGTRLKQMVDGA